ncbi:hypothetical protein PV325_005000 [Microctonus aethiopoides]|nr:hypothetical protein PV325_005000 [Microctonus aethiopoides]
MVGLKGKRNEKGKVAEKNKGPKSDRSKCAINESSSEDEDALCLFCNEMYSNNNKSERWSKCCVCSRWGDDSCAGVISDDADKFTCDFCLRGGGRKHKLSLQPADELKKTNDTDKYHDISMLKPMLKPMLKLSKNSFVKIHRKPNSSFKSSKPTALLRARIHRYTPIALLRATTVGPQGPISYACKKNAIGKFQQATSEHAKFNVDMYMKVPGKDSCRFQFFDFERRECRSQKNLVSPQLRPATRCAKPTKNGMQRVTREARVAKKKILCNKENVLRSSDDNVIACSLEIEKINETIQLNDIADDFTVVDISVSTINSQQLQQTTDEIEHASEEINFDYAF